MKFFLLLALASFSAFAQDMSHTESWDNSYREEADGSTTYIGGCGTHQDYEGKNFKTEKTIVPYFEPNGKSPAQIEKILSKLESGLRAVLNESTEDSLDGVDDLTIEKLSSKRFAKLDLYLVNMGVGGGNGIIFVYNKNGKKFELMSQVMDGDVEFCDRKVWIK